MSEQTTPETMERMAAWLEYMLCCSLAERPRTFFLPADHSYEEAEERHWKALQARLGAAA